MMFRLRVGLSQLKSHKKTHRFLDTPSDVCDCGIGSEDNLHFFIKCGLHQAARINLVRATVNIFRNNNLIHLSQIELVKVYMYGHPDINCTENCLILKASIKYIKETERFS